MSNKKKEERDLSLLGASFGLLGRGFKITMIIMVVSMLIVCIIAEQEAIEKKKNSEQAIRLRIERTKEERSMLDQKILDDGGWNAATQYLQNNGDLGGTNNNNLYDQEGAIAIAYTKLEPNELAYIKDFYDMSLAAKKYTNDQTGIDIAPYYGILIPGIESTDLFTMSKDGCVPLVPTNLVVDTYEQTTPTGKNCTFKDATWKELGLSTKTGGGGNKFYRAVADTDASAGDGDCKSVFQMQPSTVTVDANGDGEVGSPYNTYDALFSIYMRGAKFLSESQKPLGGGTHPPFSEQPDFDKFNTASRVLCAVAAHNNGEAGGAHYFPSDTLSQWYDGLNKITTDQNITDTVDPKHINLKTIEAASVKHMKLNSGWYFNDRLCSYTQADKLGVSGNANLPNYGAILGRDDRGSAHYNNEGCVRTDGANHRYWAGVHLARYVWGCYTYILGKECGGTYAQAGPSTMQQQGSSIGAGQSMGTMMYSTYKDFTTAGASQSGTQNPFTGSNPLDESVFKSWAQSGSKGSGDPRENAGDYGEQGWKGSFPLIYQSPLAYGGTTRVGTDSQTMAQAGCSVYSLFTCLVGMGYGKTPIPKPKGLNSGYSGNGLNSKGVMDIKEFAQACKVAMTADDVRKLGYKAKVGNPTNSEAEWRAIFNDVKNGHPYSANFKDNRSAIIPSYDKRTMQLVSTTDTIVPGGCGHFIPIVNVFTYNGEEYFEVANSCGMTGDRGVKSGVGSEFLCYKVEDFVKNHRGSVGQGVCYTVTGI